MQKVQNQVNSAFKTAWGKLSQPEVGSLQCSRPGTIWKYTVPTNVFPWRPMKSFRMFYHNPSLGHHLFPRPVAQMDTSESTAMLTILMAVVTQYSRSRLTKLPGVSLLDWFLILCLWAGLWFLEIHRLECNISQMVAEIINKLINLNIFRCKAL